MKKIVSAMLCAVLIMSLCACSLLPGFKKDKSVEVTEPAVEETEKPRKEAPAQESPDYSSEDDLEDMLGEVRLEEVFASISNNVEVGTAGSGAKAVAPTAELINWGIETAMKDSEIQTKLISFLDALGSEGADDFRAKLKVVDNTYALLMQEGQEELVASAGCEDCGYPWKASVIPAVEAIMEVAGLRNAVADTTVYDGVLTEYYTAVSEKLERTKLEEKDLNGLIADSYGENPLDNVGYCFTDINYDGVQELVIGVISADEFFSKLVFDLYSVRENAVVRIARSGERDRYYLCGDNTIQNEGSSGANDSITAIFILENGELVKLNELKFSGAWTLDGQSVTDEEAKTFSDSRESIKYALTLTPLSSFTLPAAEQPAAE